MLDSSVLLRNARQEQFAQAVVSGKSATEAYKLAGYSAKDADVNGPRLMGNDRVAARIAFPKK
jgi:phage terminase small subunit